LLAAPWGSIKKRVVGLSDSPAPLKPASAGFFAPVVSNVNLILTGNQSPFLTSSLRGGSPKSLSTWGFLIPASVYSVNA